MYIIVIINNTSTLLSLLSCTAAVYREKLQQKPARYSGNKCFFSSDSTFMKLFFWTRATFLSCTRQLLFDKYMSC